MTKTHAKWATFAGMGLFAVLVIVGMIRPESLHQTAHIDVFKNGDTMTDGTVAARFMTGPTGSGFELYASETMPMGAVSPVNEIIEDINKQLEYYPTAAGVATVRGQKDE